MEFAVLSGIVSGIGGGGWWAYTKLVRPIIKKEKDQKRKIFEMVKNIHSEVNYNGGGSIKDAINELKNTTKKINFKLGEIEENQKVSMNVQGIAFWNSDENGECVYASPALCKIIGRSESELKGNNWLAWLTKEDKDKIFNAWKFSVENRSPFDEIYHYKKPDGEVIKVWGLAFHKQVEGVHRGTLGKLVQISDCEN